MNIVSVLHIGWRKHASDLTNFDEFNELIRANDKASKNLCI